MSDVGPDPASAGFPAPDFGAFYPPPGSTPETAFPGPYPEPPPERPSRRMRGPLIGVVAGALAVALGVGGYLIVQNVSASRNNKPISTSSHVQSGGVTVTGHGIQLTFPTGWENVPTSPNQLRQFVKETEARYGRIPAALQSDLNNSQLLGSVAMLVFRVTGQGNFAENLNAIVEPGVLPPSQMIATLQSGQGPAQFGATDVTYTVTKFGKYQGVLVTYALQTQGITVYGAQSYLDGPQQVVITTVTSPAAATSEADLTHIVATVKFV